MCVCVCVYVCMYVYIWHIWQCIEELVSHGKTGVLFSNSEVLDCPLTQNEALVYTHTSRSHIHTHI